MKAVPFALLVATSLFLGTAVAQEPPGHPPVSLPHDKHHAALSQELMAFHDLMEPLWHAPPGRETSATACKQADEIIVRAKAAASRPTTDYAALIRAANALKRSCDESKPDDTESVLALLHGVFHRLSGM